MLNNWLILTLFSALFGAGAKILQKVILNKKDSDAFSFSILFQLLCGLVFTIYALLSASLEFPNLLSIIPNLLAMPLLYSLGNLLIFKAFSYAEASEVTIILASNSLWAGLAAIFLLGESLNARNLLGIALIMLGLVITNYVKKTSTSQFNKGHLFAIIGSIFFGFAFTNDTFILGHYNSIPSYMILAFSLPGLTTILYQPKAVTKLSQYLTKPRETAIILLAVMFTCLSAITIFSAFKAGGPAGIIAPISQVSIIFTIAISYFFLGEKQGMIKKILGTLAMVTGIFFLI